MHQKQGTHLCAVDTSVNIRCNAGGNSDGHSSIIDQLLVAMFSIQGQHLVARSAAVLTVLQLSSRHVLMQTFENWRDTEVTRDRHGSITVVHTPSSSIVPSKFVHTTSGVIDNKLAI